MKVYGRSDPLTGREIWLRKTCKTERAAQIELGRLLEQASAGRQPETNATVAEPMDKYAEVGRSTTASATPIEAHLTIVSAALAISRWIEIRTGWSIRRFVKTARRCRTIQIQAGQHTVTAAAPLPDDLRHALSAISRSS